MSFHVGQKVVCVKPETIRGCRGEVFPLVGGIYTVRGSRVRADGEIGILLEEIKNEVRRYNGYAEPVEPTFFAHRFRPIVERKTDISFAHEILKKVTRKQTVRA